MRTPLIVALALASSLALAQGTPTAPASPPTASSAPRASERPGPGTPLPANLNISAEDVTRIRALQTQREGVRAQVRTARIAALQAELDALRAGKTDAEARAAARQVTGSLQTTLRPTLQRWLSEVRALERKYPGLRFDTSGLPLARLERATPRLGQRGLLRPGLNLSQTQLERLEQLLRELRQRQTAPGGKS